MFNLHGGQLTKCCVKCLDNFKRSRQRTKCEHGRPRSKCKDCGWGGICEHNKQRSRCKNCGGGGICEHNRERSQCKDCGGGQICEHNQAAPHAIPLGILLGPYDVVFMLPEKTIEK